MCGIAGFTQRDWLPGPDRIHSATATLIHRGPDQQGVFESSLCALGATRLKILDLDHGDQPMKSADGDTVLVFNGEIYNHRELRAELESRGHVFRSHCDTEVVLHAFLEWDTECFRRLRGMFGLALWTGSKKRLVLARDRMGIKPLYVARRGGDILFGSELKAILIHPEIERRLCIEGLDCYLSLNYVPSPWTLVDGIEKLPPGTWLEWRDGSIGSGVYWELPRSASGPRSFDAAREELDLLLQQSTREHLLSDVPLGVWLSGGIDSSTILHYAAQASGSRLKTFSISFHGRSFDESRYIAEVASRYGTEHEEFDLGPDAGLSGESLEDAIAEFAYYSDEPSADAGALPVWFLSKLCRTRTTVALSGEGADEIFAGYLTYGANRVARRLRSLPRPLLEAGLAALGQWPVSDDKISLEYKLKRLLEGSLMPPSRAHVHWNGTFSEAQKAGLVRQPLPSALLALLTTLDDELPGDGLSPYLRFDQKVFLSGDILVKSDRMSMAHSVEVRPPFLDHRIVEFAATLPADFKMRGLSPGGSQQKLLLRELMKDKLPRTVLKRKKVGFDIPAHDWLRGPLRALLTETLEEGASTYSGFFHSEAIHRYLTSHLERRANIGYHLWGLMILFLWMKKWRIQAMPSSTRSRQTHAAEEAGIPI